MGQQIDNTQMKHDVKQIIEIYKVYLQMADKISDRRQSANSFFLTINTVVVGLITYLSFDSVFEKYHPFYGLVSIAGMVICYYWYRLIRSYKDLNFGKFKIVHEIEKLLPVSPFDDEWEVLGRGKDKLKFLPFTNIEMRVPWIFFSLHAVVFLMSILWPWVLRLLERMNSITI